VKADDLEYGFPQKGGRLMAGGDMLAHKNLCNCHIEWEAD
jgi:hypothetical protein